MEIKDEQEPTHHVKRLKQLMFYVLFYVIILRHGLGYSFECLSIYTEQDFYTKRSRRNEIINKQYFSKMFFRNYQYIILPNHFLVPLITDFSIVVVTIFLYMIFCYIKYNSPFIPHIFLRQPVRLCTIVFLFSIQIHLC